MDTMYEPEIWYYEHNNTRIGPVTETEIKNRLKNRQLTGESIVWKKGFDSWRKIKDSDLRPLLPYSDVPPPLQVNNTFVWILIMLPLVDTLFSLYTSSIFLHIAELAATLLAAYFDDRQIDKAGYRNNNNWLWVIILVPVYLWQRAKLIRQSKIYFWLWILSLVIAVAVDYVLTKR